MCQELEKESLDYEHESDNNDGGEGKKCLFSLVGRRGLIRFVMGHRRLNKKTLFCTSQHNQIQRIQDEFL